MWSGARTSAKEMGAGWLVEMAEIKPVRDSSETAEKSKSQQRIVEGCGGVCGDRGVEEIAESGEAGEEATGVVDLESRSMHSVRFNSLVFVLCTLSLDSITSTFTSSQSKGL